MTTSSNHYRKCRSLLSKVVSAGCTAPEHVAATNLAVSIVAKHGLDAGRLAWPEPPKGWRWSGVVGESELVEMPAEQPKARKRKAKAKGEPKAPRVTVGDRWEAMLRRPDGVSIAEMMAEFNILQHSARAIVSVEKRRRNLNVVLQDGRYRLAS